MRISPEKPAAEAEAKRFRLNVIEKVAGRRGTFWTAIGFFEWKALNVRRHKGLS